MLGPPLYFISLAALNNLETTVICGNLVTKPYKEELFSFCPKN